MGKMQKAHFFVALFAFGCDFLSFSSRYNIVTFSGNERPVCVIELNLLGKSILYPQEHVLQRAL